MDNNDLLIRIRYALDIKNTDMVKIFALGDTQLTKEEVLKLLTKTAEDDQGNTIESADYAKCTNRLFESFLNGHIIFRRGRQELKPGQTPRNPYIITGYETVNNVMLKKLKIALSLTAEDMIDIFSKADIKISKGELGNFLRGDSHNKYMECGNKYARKFLKGLTVKYRG